MTSLVLLQRCERAKLRSSLQSNNILSNIYSQLHHLGTPLQFSLGFHRVRVNQQTGSDGESSPSAPCHASPILMVYISS
jgi:hypothetical protein